MVKTSVKTDLVSMYRSGMMFPQTLSTGINTRVVILLCLQSVIVETDLQCTYITGGGWKAGGCVYVCDCECVLDLMITEVKVLLISFNSLSKQTLLFSFHPRR